jgi:hypothetical protein
MKDRDVVASAQKSIGHMRSDETGAANEESSHPGRISANAATSSALSRASAADGRSKLRPYTESIWGAGTAVNLAL